MDFHTFSKLEMRPAVHRTQLTGDARALVDEMLSYKRQFEAVRDAAAESEAHELDSFWLRKTRKAVISVVMTKQGVRPRPRRRPPPLPRAHVPPLHVAGDAPVFYRGMNVEVSMPTGTLCAERNAIGNALAANQTLRRQDIKAVAVLSLHLKPTHADVRDAGGGAAAQSTIAGAQGGDVLAEVALNPLAPCGACMEWLKKIAEVNPDFEVITFSDTACDYVYQTPVPPDSHGGA